METLSISLGGGAGKTGTAAPGSSYVCDACGAGNDLRIWEMNDAFSAKVFVYCASCWVDIEESMAELGGLAEDAEYTGGCDDCGSPTAHTCEFWHTDGRTLHLCESCYQSTDHSEPIAAPATVQCDDCRRAPATETFNHLDGRTFKLCLYCLQLADHEEDYGADFGSTPNLRPSGRPKFCDCAVPCSFDYNPSHCELCNGIVVLPNPDSP